MLKHYHIDLRSFPLGEREKLYKLLDGLSFICNPFIDHEHIGVYDVFWERSEPIGTVLNIPQKFIIPQL